MPPRTFDQVLQEQQGVCTRRQALDAVGRSAVEHRISRIRSWQVLLPGVYLTTTGEPTLHQLRRAALLYGGEHALLGAATAAAVHGLRYLPPVQRVSVLVPHGRRPASAGFAVVRRTHRPDLRWVRRDGLAVCSIARSVADACRDLSDVGDGRALVAEAVQRRLTTVDRLTEELGAGPSAGSALLRRVLAEVSAGPLSAPEIELRATLRGSGLPEPLWNTALMVRGVHVATPDAHWRRPRLALEVDSRQWHLSPADWERTMRRHARLAAAGFAVIHLSPDRIRRDRTGARADVVAAYRALAS